jgi:hypothetical protein
MRVKVICKIMPKVGADEAEWRLQEKDVSLQRRVCSGCALASMNKGGLASWYTQAI